MSTVLDTWARQGENSNFDVNKILNKVKTGQVVALNAFQSWSEFDGEYFDV